MGCSYRIVNWFASYLSKRRQRVVINGQSSDWVYILAGVPQGSILGRLLFLNYINDVVKHIGCSIRLFADDTSLYIIVDCPIQSANFLTLICKLSLTGLLLGLSLLIPKKHSQ